MGLEVLNCVAHVAFTPRLSAPPPLRAGKPLLEGKRRSGVLFNYEILPNLKIN